MRRPSLLLRSTVRVLVVFAVAATGAVVFAVPASAHCANNPHQFLDGQTGAIAGSNVNIRSGPHFGCGTVDQASFQLAQYNCWSPGDVDPATGVATWTFLTTDTLVQGWVNDAYLTNFGSNRRCNGT